MGQDRVALLQGDVELAHQDRLVEQVLDPDADAGGFVLVAGADAAAGRPDRELAEPLLGGSVEGDVVRRDEVRVGGDAEVVDRHAALDQAVQFPAEDVEVDDDAVADEALGAGVEDPGGDEVELVDLLTRHDRVPGVVAPLVAGDDIAALSEQVDDLSLSLVAPLGSDHDQRRQLASSVFSGSMAVRVAPRGSAPTGRSMGYPSGEERKRSTAH